MAFLEVILSNTPNVALGVKPYLLNGKNWLFISPDELAEELHKACEDLPSVTTKRPGGRLELPLDENPWEEESDDIREIEFQLSLIKDLPQGTTPSDWVSLLGPRGYLNGSPDECATNLGISQEQFLKTLKEIQDQLDPPGVFAKDLRDCLLIQLRRLSMDNSDSDGARLLKDFHRELESSRLDLISEATGWDLSRIKEAIMSLRKLDPSPLGIVSTPVRPEISMIPYKDGISFKILRENVPSISLTYPSKIKGKLRSILMRLSGRYRTLATIGLAITVTQRNFLSGNTEYLEPLTVKDLARITNLSPSTVSRCTRGTYAVTQYGTISLSRLLSKPLRANTNLSIHRLTLEISKLKSLNLSDLEISKRLGVPRRTLAYHRKRRNFTCP
jgi:RNA polymerase sigma-54 factor